LGQIRGLKNYITVAEKDKMEMFVRENPTLFYDVLPYAYVLGVSDVYMKKFENVNIVQPEWYHTDSSWTKVIVIDHCLHHFSMSMNKNLSMHTASQIGKTASTVGRISGGGHSGGGGFSGGGHGGGGGGRW
jgi:uncharacterized membrane protein